MTAQECLLHSWLTGDHSDRTQVIASSRYTSMRDKIRAKYENWDAFGLPLGRLSEYSSLRKLLIDKYKIHETSFGKQHVLFKYFQVTISYFFQIEDRLHQDLSSNHKALSVTRAKA